MRAQTWRPRRLLVIVNPVGGSRQAPSTWSSTVAPVFRKAGIKVAVVETQEPQHAVTIVRQVIGGGAESDAGAGERRSLSPTGADRDKPRRSRSPSRRAYDGVVAVGGDGLFHEIVNGVLGLRAAGCAAVAPGAPFRIGHIPAGSTDAVACTLNGTRSAFTAAVHVVLGDGVALDVLRLEREPGLPDFATCMVSYGFMGDLMAESERLRWLGPARYEVVGAKMLAANRSYTARVSYLAPAAGPGRASFSHACLANCEFCARGGREGCGGAAGFAASAEELWERRRAEFVHLPEQEFAGIMLVIMPCRSDKSKKGVAKYASERGVVVGMKMVVFCGSDWRVGIL